MRKLLGVNKLVLGVIVLFSLPACSSVAMPTNEGSFIEGKNLLDETDSVTAACRKFNSVDEKKYLPGFLEYIFLCSSYGLSTDDKLEAVIEKRISAIENGNQEAIDDAKLHVASYVVKEGSNKTYEAGYKMLIALLENQYDSDGRFNFLLGVSYLNGRPIHDSDKALLYLNSAADKEHILALTLLAYIYQNGYKNIHEDNDKSSAYIERIDPENGRELSEKYEMVVDYLKRNELIQNEN